MRRKNIGYLRVSTNEQKKEGFSILEQKNKLLSLAERRNEVIHEFIADEGFSGSNLKRKGVQKLLKMISRNEVARVYIWIPSRLSRDILHSTSLTKVFDKYNVEIICYSGQWLSLDEKNRDPESGFNESIIRLVDQLEVERTRIRTVHGMIGSAKLGNYPIGSRRAPIGYNKVKNGNSVRLEIDPQYRESILYIFRSIVEKRMTFIEIAHNLNKMNLTNEKWTNEKLSRLVNNPIYCGWFKRDWFEMERHSPAFITKEYWLLTQKVLTKRKNTFRHMYLFKTRIFCACCGDVLVCEPTKKMIGKKGAKKPKIYRYYVCKKCNKRISEDKVFKHIVKMYLDDLKDTNEKEHIKELEKKIKRTEKTLSSLLNDFSEGYVSEERFQILRKESMLKLSSLEDEYNSFINNKDKSFLKKTKKEQEKIISDIIGTILVDLKTKKIVKVLLKNDIILESD